MNGFLFVVAGALFFSGTIVFSRGVGNVLPRGALRNGRERISALNMRLQKICAAKGVIRFPGVELVEEQRPWVIGECLGGALVALSLVHFRPFPDRLLSVFVSCLAGAATTYLLLESTSRRQLHLVRDELPAAAHLLSLLLEAGHGPYAGMQELINALPPRPLRRQLQELFRARTLGVPPVEAFERARRRVPLDEYRVFLNQIQQGERLGVGLSRGLRELSERMLENQALRAETAAQKAAVKMLFPLIFFIFPAVFLVVLSPVILRLGEMFGGPP